MVRLNAQMTVTAYIATYSNIKGCHLRKVDKSAILTHCILSSSLLKFIKLVPIWTHNKPILTYVTNLSRYENNLLNLI